MGVNYMFERFDPWPLETDLGQKLIKEGPHMIEQRDLGGMADGGEREQYDGGCLREPTQADKGRYDLISPFAMQRLARWYAMGAEKYGDRNWEKGMPYSRCIDSAKRHIDKFLMGWIDEDHLAAAVWNLVAIMHYQAFPTMDEQWDDLPDYKHLVDGAGREYIDTDTVKEIVNATYGKDALERPVNEVCKKCQCYSCAKNMEKCHYNFVSSGGTPIDTSKHCWEDNTLDPCEDTFGTGFDCQYYKAKEG